MVGHLLASLTVLPARVDVDDRERAVALVGDLDLDDFPLVAGKLVRPEELAVFACP